MAKSFKAIFRYLMPSWLTTGEGEKVWTVIASAVDDNILLMRESLYAQLPSKAQDDALKKIGADRLIKRGRSEARDHYIARLRGWRYPFGHRVRGSAFGLIDQIRTYWDGPGAVTSSVATWDRNGNYYLVEGENIRFVSHNGPDAWNWDSVGPEQWARFWVVAKVLLGVSPGPKIGDPNLWGGTIGPGNRQYTIGQSGVTPDDIAAMRELVLSRYPWKPDGTRAEWIIVSFDLDNPTPTGNWQNHAHRNPAFRYWSLLR